MNILLSAFRKFKVSCFLYLGCAIFAVILLVVVLSMISDQFKYDVVGLGLIDDVSVLLVFGLLSGIFITSVSLFSWCFIQRVRYLNSNLKKELGELKEYERKYKHLRVVVDAHAVMAITDSLGVITEINDKFCALSQYSREELVGKTHRVISSGYHDREFYKNLWETIAKGEIWRGDICNKAKDGSLYWVNSTLVPLMGENGKPERYISLRADITDRKHAEQKSLTMAMYDELTGLPNRYLMRERLVRAIFSKQNQPGYGAVLMMDLDHFKEVNDMLGHAVGDQLLEKTTYRLTQSARPADTVARFGGDEFVIILDDIGLNFDAAIENMTKISKSILDDLATPYYFGNQPLEVTPSIGVVLFSSDKDDPEELIKQADMALYKAKESGRNRVCFFDPSLQEEALEKALLVRDLRTALENEEMLLLFQPIVDADKNIKGVEALIRWDHPDYGRVSPSRFIPLAESSGLILPIGRWVLETACRQQASWKDDPQRKDWVVSINVCAFQLGQADFVETVKGIIEKTGACASCISLELTESTLQENVENTIKKMDALGRLGVQFSLDDFGTGFSSLSYLKRLPIDYIKIDKSFIDDIFDDPCDADIVRTIIVLAQTLEVGIIAEGVETKEQFEWLFVNGCMHYQGYLFGKPMNGNELKAS